ncbi:MAG: CHAD domain-containing protein [Chloroflexota bacterium]|nr:CHAD domain-containing protein [Chloroflexota bacterium]
MESEAKFIVPDAATYAKLRRMPRPDAYRLGKPTVKTVQDRYVDTAEQHFFQQHIAARLREADGKLLLTLKSFGDPPRGAIHRRSEVESVVPSLDIATWPPGEVRAQAEEIAGHEPLRDLVRLTQTRVVALVTDEARLVAEWSLDEVLLDGADRPFYELEIELRPDGRQRDLRELSDWLMDKYGLRPQTLSKFERAMRARPAVARNDAPTTRLPAAVPAAATLTVVPAAPPATPTTEPADAAIPTLPPLELTVPVATDLPTAAAKPARKRSPKSPATSPSGAVGANSAPVVEAVPLVEEPPPAAVAAASAPDAPDVSSTDPAPPATSTKPLPGLTRTDSMARAGRKVLRIQVERLHAIEEIGPVHTNPESIHDMRVATRRMRAALPIFRAYERGGIAGPLQRGVRDLTHALGAVRDLDVLIDHAQEFRAALPPDQQADLDGLLTRWRADHDKAQHALADLLDSADYRRLKKKLRAFVHSTPQDAPRFDGDTPQPYQVRHVAGGAIWTQYEAMRAYEAIMDEITIPQLHALRISGKYLRYTLEFFREVLPDAAGVLIRDVVEMQDQLGALHDAEVAAGFVRTYVTHTHGRYSKHDASPIPAGLADYLAEREHAAGTIHSEFALTWTHLTSPDWRGRLAQAIAAI